MTFLVDQPPSMIFSLVEEIHQKYGDSISISEMCKMANVSRSGYYAWKRAAPKREKREAQDRADFSLILKAFAQEGYEKGGQGPLHDDASLETYGHYESQENPQAYDKIWAQMLH